MDFSFSDEIEALRRTVAQVVADELPAAVAKELDDSGDWPARFYARMAELDWFRLPFPEDVGGMGGGATEALVVAEELGRSSLDISSIYTATLIPALTIARWGTAEQKAEILPALLRGDIRLSISMSEPDAGSDVSAIRTRARRGGRGWVVRGEKMWCTGAALPHTRIAMYVRTAEGSQGRDGISLLVVDPSAPGVTLHKIPTLARHVMGTYAVSLDDVEVGEGDLIGPEGEGWSVVMSGLEIERVLVCGGYIGVAQQTIDEAVAYAQQREQFGQKIGAFQAISHPLVDLQARADAARLLTYRAAWLLDRGEPCAREGSMAKLFASETYVDAARWGMQVMAGYGFSTESTMSFRYRESIVSTISGGTSQIQRNGIARSMGLGRGGAPAPGRAG